MASVTVAEKKRILLLMSPATYRAGAFLQAAQGLGLEVVVGIDLPRAWPITGTCRLGLIFRISRLLFALSQRMPMSTH